jgi:hypothetical protein
MLGQILTFYLFGADDQERIYSVLMTKRDRQSISDSAVNVWPIPKADLNLKIIIGLCLCIIGAIIWAVPLVTASVIVHPGDISLGVIIGGD